VNQTARVKEAPAPSARGEPAGALPPPRRGLSPLLVTLNDPLSPAAESVRALRTHILAQHVHYGRRALAIAGPNDGVGCSFVAANLSVALAQVGIKTLLIDGNLRWPELNRYIPSTSNGSGLVGALSGARGSIGDFIEADVLPNLSMLYAGAAAENAQELLARDRFEDVMRQCMRDFDMTVIDTPPANTCADARRIGSVVGYSLVVAKLNKSLVADVKTLVNQLTEDHARVIGTILNSD
jgi:capsular exopolysaccharide synthesis family protein